jgi:GTP-binding protein
VLQKAIEIGLKPIVVINKVDKPNCTPDEAHEAVFDLMYSLGATEDQLDFQVVFGSAKNNWMGKDWRNPPDDITYLLDTIVEHIPPPVVAEGSTQMLITSLDYSAYIGRIAIGRLYRGSLKDGQTVALMKKDGTVAKSKIRGLFVFEGFGKIKTERVEAGEICGIVGVEGFEIGDTVADAENPEGMTRIAVDEPTISMVFTINDSPFFGKEGKFVTSRHLRERLEKELEKNLALRLESTAQAETFIVYGRGVLHLSVLIETMRREGYELQIGQPQVILKNVDGAIHEPIEEMTIDLPENMAGTAIDMVTRRKGVLLSMLPKNDRVILQLEIPSRGIIGIRSQMLTATQGEAVMTHRFKEFQPYKGEVPSRINGSLISMETGTAIPYSIFNLQDRGSFFVDAGEEIYEGQVIGENTRAGDMMVNLTKTKKLTNMRASGSDEKVRIIPPIKFSLEEALEYIQEDEYVEVTPKSIRLRKILLKEHERKRSKNSALSASVG